MRANQASEELVMIHASARGSLGLNLEAMLHSRCMSVIHNLKAFTVPQRCLEVALGAKKMKRVGMQRTLCDASSIIL